MLRERGATKRCLNRKQGDCRQRKKEETKGVALETTLSRLSYFKKQCFCFPFGVLMIIYGIVAFQSE